MTKPSYLELLRTLDKVLPAIADDDTFHGEERMIREVLERAEYRPCIDPKEQREARRGK